MMAGFDLATAHAILAWLEAQSDAMVGLLRRLVEAESPSADIAAQRHTRAILATQLDTMDFRVRHVRGGATGDHLLALPKDRVAQAPSQLIVGHLDTVWPVGTLATMPIQEQAGHITGPGSYDMKAGLVQGLFAIASLQAIAWPISVTPVLFINADEEIGSPSSGRWVRRLARSAVRAFILEPSFGPRGALKTVRKGVGQFTLHIRGRAAHAGVNPEAGVSAILELSYQVQQIFALNDPDQGISVNVGTIDGGLQPNMVAPAASAVIDVRVPTAELGLEVEQALRSLQPVQPGTTLSITGGMERPPMAATPRNQQLWHAAEQAAAILGIPLEEASVGGASDGNFTSLHTATLDGLGAVGDGAHAATEYVERVHLCRRAALLAVLLAAPAGLD